MPPFLLVDIRNLSAQSPLALSGGTVENGARAGLLEKTIKTHRGTVAPATGDVGLLFFEEAGDALRCALATQARLAKFNRERGEGDRVLLRIAGHATADARHRLPEGDLNAAMRILEATPPGRVFLSRELYAPCRNERGCAFLPLGLEYFSGLPQPLELFEVFVPDWLERLSGVIARQPRSLAGSTGSVAFERSASQPRPELVAVAASRPPHVDAPAPVSEAELVLFDASPLTAALTVAAAIGLYSVRGALDVLFTALVWVHAVPMNLGGFIFSFGGASQAGANFGAALADAGLPAAVLLYCCVNALTWGAYASLFWLGEGLFGLALSVLMSVSSDFGAFRRDVFTGALETLGLQRHVRGAGETVCFAGCLLMGYALVSALRRLRVASK